MGNSESKTTSEASTAAPPTPAVQGEKPKCKACCACPETKQVRDKW